MAATFTVTGKGGAGLSLTAAVFARVEWFNIDANLNMLTLKQDGVILSPIDIGAATTVTVLKSGNTWTVTIS